MAMQPSTESDAPATSGAPVATAEDIDDATADVSLWGPLRSRDYRWFLLGGLTFSGSLWVGITAVGWIALELTGSPSGVTLASAVWFSPFVVLALPAGVLADSMDRRWLMIVLRGLSAVLMLAGALIAFSGQLTYPLLLVLAACNGALIIIEMPARQAYIAMLVPRGQLVNAMAMLSSEGSVSRVAGPLLAGILLDETGAGGAFLAFAVLCLMIIIFTLRIRTPGRVVRERAPGAAAGRMHRELMEGLRHIAGHRDARAVVTLAILAGTVSWVYVTLLPVMTREVFDGDARLLGTLSAAIGIGQVPSAVLLAFYRNFRHTGIAYIASMLTLGLAIVGYAVSTSVPLTLGLLALTGLTFSSQHIMLNAILLRIVEPRFHGRVLGAMFLPWGFNVLGLLSAGAIAEALGVQLAVGLSGALLVIFASGAVLLRPQLLRI
ncbi:MAG: MFS transporter [Chloroflexi bacterium]|nr:MFS transporter [Chloroflexota bacterium]